MHARRFAAAIGLALLPWPALAWGQDYDPFIHEGEPPTTAAAAEPAAAEEPPDPPTVELEEPEGGWISKRRYIGGGVASSFLSFGAGHMIAGEWVNFGWFYTTTQVLGTGMFIGGFFGSDAATTEIEELPDEWEDRPYEEQKRRSDELSDRGLESLATAIMISGATIFVVSYVAEKVDYWVRAGRRVHPGGPVVKRPAFLCTEGGADHCLTKREYVSAGVVGTLVGFGSGHYMTDDDAWGNVFLGAELAHVVFGIAGASLLMEAFAVEGSDVIGVPLLIYGASGFLALRIWEKVDVWKRPRHARVETRPRKAGPEKVALSPLVLPAVSDDRVSGVVLGVGGTF